MPIGHWNLEWLSHNGQRNYPIAADANVTDQSGDFVIPEDFILEMDVPVHAGLSVDPAKFYIKHLGAFATGYSVVIGYDDGAGGVNVATALINRNTHTRNDSYALGGVGDFDDTMGKIVIGRLDSIDDQPAGYYTFDPSATRLEPDAVRPIIRGVSSLVVVNGTERSDRLYGDIELRAGTNMQLVPVVVSGEDPVIVFSAIDGEGTIEECICLDETDSPPLRTINGIPPTPAGDFTMLGDDCLEFQAIANGLRAVDTCSKPCCGCEELEAITRDLERFGSQATTLENFLVSLETRVTQMDQVVLGAKLNDRGCVQCE